LLFIRTTITVTMGEDNTQQEGAAVQTVLTTLQPIRDLAKNWDIDIASWYVTLRSIRFNVLTQKPRNGDVNE
jgi:hypothetical protein